MATIQTSYERKNEPDEVVEWKEAVRKAVKICEYRCMCGGIDYEVLHPKTRSLNPPDDAQVNCKTCGQKHYFNLDRLSKFVKERYG